MPNDETKVTREQVDAWHRDAETAAQLAAIEQHAARQAARQTGETLSGPFSYARELAGRVFRALRGTNTPSD